MSSREALAEVDAPAECVGASRFIVAVDFGGRNVAATVAALEPLAARHGATIIDVDTSELRSLRDGAPVNEAFEFSGYQYGLERALARAGPDARQVTVAFVNGTALTAHLPFMLRRCLSEAFRTRRDDAARVFSGFRHRCGPPRSAVAKLGYYVATYAFWLAGDSRALRQVTLYDRSVVGREGLERAHGDVAPDYRRAIDAWLCPSSLWRGWYKAMPGEQVEPETLYRKRLAIYFEHALPSRLAARGFAPPQDAGSAGASDLLMALDKLYVNVLKARYRLGHLLRRQLRTRGSGGGSERS